MKSSTKIVLTALLVSAITVPSMLVWAALTQTFIFASRLQVTSFNKDDDAYTAHVTDVGQEVAHIYVRVENP